MNLEDIGFYTLSDLRAKNSSVTSPLVRCELVLTGRCNFKCPYCRSVGGQDLPLDQAKATVNLWCDEGLTNIRFTGGEPTLYKGLGELVTLAKSRGVERIALSTNGATAFHRYEELIALGVNDFSVSLDACCAEDGDSMAGGRKGSFAKVVKNIKALSKISYVTVGVVLTGANKEKAEEVIRFADSLGVQDIRVIPAAQEGERLPMLELDEGLLKKYPILRYRVANLASGIPVRGIPKGTTNRCGLALDDMAVMGMKHYPCIIHLRENGAPIGPVDSTIREQRLVWYKNHDAFKDPICVKNCLDVCVNYNQKHASFHPEPALLV